jgi:hypothetical protein
MNLDIMPFFRQMRQWPEKWMLLLFPLITFGVVIAALLGLWVVLLLLTLG